MKNIHLFSTDKSSRLYKTGGFLLLDSRAMPNNTLETKNQYIYITSDEEIREGDWLYYKYFGEDIICKYNTMDGQNTNVNEHKDFYKKIILTTDQDLIKDGVQAIDDEFLEWFVKNPSCEEVKTYSLGLKNQLTGESGHYKYEIIIPKKEPKQETLEEFVFKVPHNYNIKPKEVIDMCMKEQENIILTWRLGHFIDMINSLPDDTEKNRILKTVFNNRPGELLLESYKSMKNHYEKTRND